MLGTRDPGVQNKVRQHKLFTLVVHVGKGVFNAHSIGRYVEAQQVRKSVLDGVSARHGTAYQASGGTKNHSLLPCTCIHQTRTRIQTHTHMLHVIQLFVYVHGLCSCVYVRNGMALPVRRVQYFTRATPSR